MTTQLALYNRACRHIGERPLASLTEDAEARYLLDLEYNEALSSCLREGLWNFALHGAKIDADPSVTPAFGYQYAVPKPPDWIRTQLVSPSEFFDPPLMDYTDQTAYWLTNLTPIYVRYISTTNGTNPAMFPPDYAEYVGYYLASLIWGRITQKSQEELIAFEKRLRNAKRNALTQDGMDQAPQQFPHGSWTTSRSRRGGQAIFPYNF